MLVSIVEMFVSYTSPFHVLTSLAIELERKNVLRGGKMIVFVRYYLILLRVSGCRHDPAVTERTSSSVSPII